MEQLDRLTVLICVTKKLCFLTKEDFNFFFSKDKFTTDINWICRKFSLDKSEVAVWKKIVSPVDHAG